MAACAVACGGDDDGSTHPDASAAADGAPADAGPPLVRLTVLDGPVPTDATWVAYQDGDGPWTVIEGSDGEYIFVVEQDRYAVAVVHRGRIPRLGKPVVQRQRRLPRGLLGYGSSRTVADIVQAIGAVAGMAPTGDEDGLLLTAASQSGLE